MNAANDPRRPSFSFSLDRARSSWLHAFAACTALCLAPLAGAQCPKDWLPGEGAPGVVGTATVFASTAWDPDGAGPQSPLAVFGGTMLAAGDVAVHSVAAWDGAAWHALGDGLPAQVRALTVYNGELIAAAGNNTFGGTGPANGVARWDAGLGQWKALSGAGFQNVVWSLAVYDGDLIAGGLFSSAGGAPVNNIARWNGTRWQPMGSGVANGVASLIVFNGELYAAGSGVKKWNGTSWVTFGPNLTGSVNALSVHNGKLVAGGLFHTASGGPFKEVARWDGAAWQPMGVMNDMVNCLAEFNGELIAGGTFTTANGQNSPRMARWNGAAWSPMPETGMGIPGRRCDSLIVYQGELYAGGARTEPSGLQAEHIGRWDGSQWRYLGDGFDDVIYDFATYQGDLIACGSFLTAGDEIASGIARRDNSGQWHSMGGVSGGDGYVYDLVVYDDKLIASGSFTSIDGVAAADSIAQWDGASWQPFGDAPVGRKIVAGGELYATGSFGPNRKVARWNARSRSWQPIGVFPANAGVTCLAMFDGDLVAAGIGGVGVNASVWRWDFDAPGTWQPVGQHLGFSAIQTIGVYDGDLLVGGYYDGSGGPPGGLARFDGSAWVPLGGGLHLGNESPDEILGVFDLRVYEGELIVAGTFSYAGAQQYSPGAVAAYHVARWNGSNWLPLGPGTNDAAVTLHEHDGALVIGGWFDMAGGGANGHWARWAPQCAIGDVTRDGHVDVDDLFAVINAWGDCPKPPDACPADIDGNGVADIDDLFTVINGWNP